MDTPCLTLQWIPSNSLPPCAKLCQLFLIPLKAASGAVQKQGFPAAEDTQRAGAEAQNLDQPISCIPVAGRQPHSASSSSYRDLMASYKELLGRPQALLSDNSYVMGQVQAHMNPPLLTVDFYKGADVQNF